LHRIYFYQRFFVSFTNYHLIIKLMRVILRCELTPRLVSGVVCGVGTRPLHKLFQIYLVLLENAYVVAHLKLSSGSSQ
jgi:hypothetical protein